MRIKAYFSEYEDICQELNTDGSVTYPVEITSDHSASSYGLPVVLIDEKPYGPADLPPGELLVPAEHLGRVQKAGYKAQPMTNEEVEYRYNCAPEVKSHWAPEARLVQW